MISIGDLRKIAKGKPNEANMITIDKIRKIAKGKANA